MSFRSEPVDRTKDLFQYIKIRQDTQIDKPFHRKRSAHHPHGSEKTASTAASRSFSPPDLTPMTFVAHSMTLAEQISATQDMVHNLTEAVAGSNRFGNVFDDATRDVQELISLIRRSLKEIQHETESLARKRSQTIRYSSEQEAQNEDVIVHSLRLRHMKLAKSFQNQLALRTKALAEVNKRRSRYVYHGSDRNTLFSSDERGSVESTTLKLEETASQTRDFSQRAKAAHGLEKSVHQLSDVFQDFTRLVTEQESLLLRIDDETEWSLGAVQTGQGELLRYFHSLRSNRGFILQVLSILLGFVLIIGMVVLK